MPHDYDTLIAGAGPAGCAAAYDLARAGRRVLLLDKRTFPRPKACACGLTRKTLKALRYSVAPVTERLCHEIVLQQSPPGTRIADKSLEVRVHTRNPICALAVRERFDDFCLQQTLAAGRNGGAAVLKKIDTILALRELPTHIELDIATSEGTQSLTAPVLIGADGSNGQTRRLAEGLHQAWNATGSALNRTGSALKGTGFSPSGEEAGTKGALAPEEKPATTLPTDPSWYNRGFALEATVPFAILPPQLPAGDAPHDLVFDFAPLPGGYGWLFPKGDHINIGVGAFAPTIGNSTGLKDVTRTLLKQYTQQKLGLTPEALDQLPVTGQHLGMGGHTYIPRGRVLLTGDAAGLVDPLTGEGIHSAIVSGQAAAAAILETLPYPPTLSSRPERAPSSQTLSSRPEQDGSIVLRSGETCSSPATDVAAAYARHLRPLQQTLAFSARAARAFYATPDRGFRAMRIPLMRSLILKTYADGLPYTQLLTAAAKLFT